MAPIISPLWRISIAASAFAIAAASLLLATTATPATATHAPATTFIVTSTGDDGDAMDGDGECTTPIPQPSLGPGESRPPTVGACTLRAAIEEANAHTNGTDAADRIEFDIQEPPSDDGFFHITPTTELPAIEESVVIDGFSQPGSSFNTDLWRENATQLIALDGSLAPPGTDGLVITSENVEVRGLQILFFPGDGIEATPDASGVGVYGNHIAENGGHGVFLDSPGGTAIGSTQENDRNAILENGLDGIAVTGAAGVPGNPGTVAYLRGNLIYANEGLGIDLGDDDVTPNDAGDADAGANGLQNYPTITSAYTTSAELVVAGEISSTPERIFYLDIYVNDICNVSETEPFGEGQIYAGWFELPPTDSTGTATFNQALPLPDGVAAGQLVTATANGPQFLAGLQQGTSEFSECFTIGNAPPATPQPLPSSTTSGSTPGPTAAPETVSEPVEPGGTVTSDVEGDGATPTDPVETSVTSPNGGTVTIEETSPSQPEPSGFSFLGQQVNITAPPATPEDPLVLTFVLDASLIGDLEPDNIGVFRNGELLADCSGAAGVASPDPCLASKTVGPDGDMELVALTSAASAWNFGVQDPAAPSAPNAGGGGVPNTAGLAPAVWNLTLPAALLLLGSGGMFLLTRRSARGRH